MKKFTKEELTKIAQDYKKQYPKAKQILATEDGNFFFDQGSCDNHARTGKLKKYEITLLSDAELEAIAAKQKEDEAKDKEAETARLEAEKEEKIKAETAQKASAEARILEIDFDKADEVNYDEARHLLEALNLDAKSRKKVDTIAALVALKSTLLNNKNANS